MGKSVIYRQFYYLLVVLWNRIAIYLRLFATCYFLIALWNTISTYYLLLTCCFVEQATGVIEYLWFISILIFFQKGVESVNTFCVNLPHLINEVLCNSFLMRSFYNILQSFNARHRYYFLCIIYIYIYLNI
jgi:hypothetical protein